MNRRCRGIGPLWGVVAVMVSLAGISCGDKQRSTVIDLPPAPVLSIRSNWGVVSSWILRIRQKPSVESSRILTYVTRGKIVEILSKSDNADEVEGQMDYWYLVNYMGVKGWMFGSYLEIVNSKAQAENISESFQ